MSTVMTSSVILYGGLPVPRYWPGIRHWWITVFFGLIMLSMLPLTSVLFLVYGITIDNETVSSSDVFIASLDLCETIISSLNCSPKIPLNKASLLKP